MAVEVAVVVEFLEADSGCFPFDFDEIKGKFGDVSDAFVCNGELSKALKPILFDEEFDVFTLEGKESSIGSSEGIGG